MALEEPELVRAKLTLEQAQLVATAERAWRKLRLTLSGWPGQRRERARNRGAKETSERDWYRMERDQDAAPIR